MIPKIIHYCWFGRKPKPVEVEKCISSWREKCPDFEIKEWNEESFDIRSLAYTREAYSLKKYAFVSDVARLMALVCYGGIYLDTDVELIKPLDNLMNDSLVLGLEAPLRISTAVICSPPQHPLLKGFLASYKDRHFISYRGHLDIIPNTSTLTSYINTHYWPEYNNIKILPIDILCAKIIPLGDYFITDKTIAIHHFACSWHGNKTKKKRIAFFEVIYQLFIYPNRIDLYNVYCRFFKSKRI